MGDHTISPTQREGERMSKDPLKQNNKRIKALKAEIARLEEANETLQQQRNQWPKLVRVQVGNGKWGENVTEAFAEQCGFKPKGNSLGPIDNGKYIAAQAWLIYEVSEDGTCKLVGADDQDFGKVGVEAK